MERISASTPPVHGTRSTRQAEGRRGPLRLDPSAGNAEDRETSAAYAAREFAERAHDELSPRGLIEEVLVDRIIAASWRLLREDDLGEEPMSRSVGLAEDSLRDSLSALDLVRSWSSRPAPPPVKPLLRDALPEPERWRDRLIFDPMVSEDSPVVVGTWITVDQVISRIVDSWSWDDLLHAYPELCRDDIRACLAFTVEDEEAR